MAYIPPVSTSPLIRYRLNDADVTILFIGCVVLFIGLLLMLNEEEIKHKTKNIKFLQHVWRFLEKIGVWNEFTT